MEEKTLKIQLTTEDILKGKFTNTIAKIAGYLAEAREESRDYGSNAVERRMEEISDTFHSDLLNLSQELKIQ